MIYYVKSSTLSNEEKRWALPSGDKEQIGPKWHKKGQKGVLGRQMGVPLIFSHSHLAIKSK